MKINKIVSQAFNLLQVKQSQISAASDDDIYVPQLWYFNLMMFVTENELPAESVDSMILQEEKQHETPVKNQPGNVNF